MAGVSEGFPRGMVRGKAAGRSMDPLTEGLLSQAKDLGSQKSTFSRGGPRIRYAVSKEHSACSRKNALERSRESK